MKNLVLIIIPMLFLAFIACNQQGSSSTTTTTPEPKTEETTTPKAVLNQEEKTTNPQKKQEIAAVKTTTATKEKAAIDKNTNPPKAEKKTDIPSISKTTTPAPKKTTPSPQPTTPKKEIQQEKPTPSPTQKEVTTTEPPKAETKTTSPPKVEEKPKTNIPPPPALPEHSLFDALLRQYVSSSGKVNYKGLKSNQAKLDAYLETLEKNPPQNSWSRNEKLAYWINAYNAYTLKLIVDNYPLSSITKLHGGKPWDVKWIKLGDKTYSLNNIENDIIRPRFKEARIHFAVNCAAKSCPPLLNRAWTAGNLNRYLEQQTKNFINNNKYNSISANAVKVSKIFDWYEGDFGNLVDYLNKYSNTKIDAGTKVEFVEYDWGLNE